MTREKAIRLLTTKRAQPSTDYQMAEVYTMAIQALSQEPKADKPMCDRNICLSNEYNGIGCDECIVNKAEQEPICDRDCEHCIWTECPIEPCTDTVSIRKNALKTRVGSIVAYNVEWLKKHWQMEMDIVCGVKPCEDAISREAVLEGLKGCICEEWIKTLFATMVKQLPSVQPSRKGHWLYSGENGRDKWTCDNCFDFVRKPQKTCPNCGARMESEE